MTEPAESSPTVEPDDSGASRTFRPLRSRVWAIAGVGAFLAILTLFVVLLPLAITPKNPSRPDGAWPWVLILLGLFLGGMAVWMCLLAWQLSRMRLVVAPGELELRARRYEWFITNPFGFRSVRLDWPEVQGIRRWRISNPLAPGGVQESYVLYTTRGRFVLANLDWPAVGEMAALISRNARRPIAAGVAELPAELQAEASPRWTEQAKLQTVRGFGWLAMMGGVLLLALLGLGFILGQPFQGSLASVAMAALVLVVCGESLRHFRLE